MVKKSGKSADLKVSKVRNVKSKEVIVFFSGW